MRCLGRGGVHVPAAEPHCAAPTDGRWFADRVSEGVLGLSTFQCTLGFPVRLVPPNQDGFVTNSHCSRTQGQVDNGRYWQASRPALDNDHAGVEIIDPAYTSGGGCPTGRRCRQSDAAVVQATSAGPVALGTIARTEPNSLTWNGSDRYQITAKATSAPAVGLVVQRVGRTSGRTFGEVTHSCSEKDFFAPAGKSRGVIATAAAFLLSSRQRD